jgi:UDP-2-acetamido-2,6-beta-L-arabino-hexul-4-ose reductase
MRTIGITGASGLLGFHLRTRLGALGIAPAAGKPDRRTFEVVTIPTEAFRDEAALRALVTRCDTLIHLAYQISGPSDEMRARNRELDERLTAAIGAATRPLHLIFASSTHIERDTAHGEAKRRSDAHFAGFTGVRGHPYTSLVFPHIFGEGGRPNHNSVVSTFCHTLAIGGEPVIIVDNPLELLHAQSAAAEIIKAIESRASGHLRVTGRPMGVSKLLAVLREIHTDYNAFLIPDFRDPLRLDLFNTYRSYLFPLSYPTPLTLREDARGSLFEAVKTRHGGQAFVSTSRPRVTRGNHYHLHKLERFCVIRGSATIQIRRLFSTAIHTFEVSGEFPVVIDIPTLHTHNITNTGSEDLLTLFWAHELFDPDSPDTYPEPV